MNNRITLLNWTKNYKHVRVSYNIITESIHINSWYRNKEKMKEDTNKYRQTERGREANRRSVNKYYQTDKGKENNRKWAKITQAKRKRKLGWILMFSNPFDEPIKIDYHHINDTYVVVIPRDLHKLYSGKYHREKVMEIVKQIYLEEG